MIYILMAGVPEKDEQLERDAELLAQRARRGAIARTPDELALLLGEDKKLYLVASTSGEMSIGGFEPDALAEHLIAALGDEKLEQIEQVTLHSDYSAFVKDADDLSSLLNSFAGQFYLSLRARTGRDIKVKANIGAVYTFSGGANRIRRKQVTHQDYDATLKALEANDSENESQQRETQRAGIIKDHFYEKGEGRVYFQNGRVFKVNDQGSADSYTTRDWTVD